MRQVVITGIGAVSPLGIGHEPFWEAVVHGRPRFQRISRFDTTGYACDVAGEVDRAGLADLLDPRKMRNAAAASQLALCASSLALSDAKLPARQYAPERIGVMVGTALGGWADAEQQIGVLLERGTRRVNPFIVSGAANHGPGVEVATAHDARGPQMTLSTGCPSSLQAIGLGAALVAGGVIDACLVGGTETPINPITFAALGRTQELCAKGIDPEHASCPFDRQHAGIVVSEGSCFLLLESAEAAARRGSQVYAQVCGMSSSCDAQGLYGFDPTGEPGARAVHQLLTETGVAPSELDYVCAHANSSPVFDRKEVLVLRRSLGECAARIPVSSIKGVLGHPFGAAGAFQAAATALAIRHASIPPTHNLRDPDPECDLDHVPYRARAAAIGAALVTSYGYGGVNAYLLLRAADR